LEPLRGASSDALVLLATSYLDEAARCQRPVYLDEGRVVATGTPASSATRPLELYRAWGDDVRAIATPRGRLPYVAGARAAGAAARIEVRREHSPGAERVLRDLDGLAGGVRFAEHHLPVDMGPRCSPSREA
jgi:hypothetical protein